MTWLLLPLASLVLLVFGIMEVRRAPRESVPLPRNPRLARGLVYAFVAALPLVPFSPGWLVLFEGAVGLPVEPPESPVRAEPWSFDFDLGAGFLATVVLMLLLVYVAPPLVGFLVGRRRDLAARPLPSGRRLFLVAGMVAAAVAVVATARFAIGGAAPTDFGTYGALTPDAGAAGWRADAVLSRAMAGGATLRPLAEGDPLESDVEWHPGNDCCGALASMPGWRELPGLKAWVAGRPVLIQRAEDGSLVAHAVRGRSPSDVPPERRPHFVSMPKWATGAGRPYATYVLVEDRPDGSRFAVRMTDTDAVETSVADVGLLLKPPFVPLLALLGILGLAAWLHVRVLRAPPSPPASPSPGPSPEPVPGPIPDPDSSQRSSQRSQRLSGEVGLRGLRSLPTSPLRFGAAWLLFAASFAVALVYWPYL